MSASLPAATDPATTDRAATATAASNPRAGVVAAASAAVLLLAEAVVGATASGDLADHSTGAGQVSEALVALAFLAGAVALACWLPAARDVRRLVCLPAVAGTALIGLVMVFIAATGREAPESFVTVLLLVTLAGLVTHGLVGWRAGTWPVWCAVLLGALLPVMFTVPGPANSVVMGLSWLAVAVAVARA